MLRPEETPDRLGSPDTIDAHGSRRGWLPDRFEEDCRGYDADRRRYRAVYVGVIPMQDDQIAHFAGHPGRAGRSPEGALFREAAGAGELGVRPEHLVPVDASRALASGKDELVEHLGAVTIVHSRSDSGPQIIAKFDGTRQIASGEHLHLGADPFATGALRLCDADGSALSRA